LDSISLVPVTELTQFKSVNCPCNCNRDRVLGGAVLHMAWSADSQLLATADADRCVALFQVRFALDALFSQ
jgi:hypothetical protein